MSENAKLMADLAAKLQGIDLPPQRTAELAAEVERLNGTVRGTARHLAFDDDPADYAALLATAAPR